MNICHRCGGAAGSSEDERMREAAPKMLEFVKQIANHGACRGFSVDMVRCTDETLCKQCLSCEARDLIDEIEASP